MDNLPVGTILQVHKSSKIPNGFIEYQSGKMFSSLSYPALFQLFGANRFPEIHSPEAPIGSILFSVSGSENQTWVEWHTASLSRFPELHQHLDESVALMSDAQSRGIWEAAMAQDRLPDLFGKYFQGNFTEIGTFVSGSIPNLGFQTLPVMIHEEMKVHPLGMVCPANKDEYSPIGGANITSMALPAPLVLLGKESANIKPDAKMLSVNLSGSGTKFEPESMKVKVLIKAMTSKSLNPFKQIIKAM